MSYVKSFKPLSASSREPTKEKMVGKIRISITYGYNLELGNCAAIGIDYLNRDGFLHLKNYSEEVAEEMYAHPEKHIFLALAQQT